MDVAYLSAWRALTSTVAKASGLRDSERISDEVLEVARRTCVRRANREALALAGRVRGRLRATSFTRHVVRKLENDPALPEILDGLTLGDRLIRLRPFAYLAQTTFDFDDSLLTAVVGEEELTEVLGEGFECAPQVSPGEPASLAITIKAVLDALVI
jgi:hypothetical protein